MDFGFISTYVFGICLDLSAPLVLVIFDNPSIRKRVSCKSESIKFSTFSAFVWTSFQVRFSSDFVRILKQFWAPFGTIFEKKTFLEIVSKKGDPLGEN